MKPNSWFWLLKTSLEDFGLVDLYAVAAFVILNIVVSSRCRDAQPGTGYSETREKTRNRVLRDPVLYRPGSVPIDQVFAISSYILAKPIIYRVYPPGKNPVPDLWTRFAFKKLGVGFEYIVVN